MAKHRTKSMAMTIAVLMMAVSGLFSGSVFADTADTGAGDETRVAQQAGGLSTDYLCVSRYTGQFRVVFSASCPSGYQLIVLSQSFPFDYCYSMYTRIMSDDRANNTCPPGSRYVVVDGLSSFAACYNRYTGQLYHTTVAAGCAGGQVPLFFVDLRGGITKYACVEENLNTEECDFFPAGPHNEIRQIGPMPNTSAFFEVQWQWVFDGVNSPTQSCSSDCDNASIEAALEALPGINDVSVTGGPIAGTVDAPIRIEFVGVDAQTDIVPEISIQNVANTINQDDVTIVDGAVNGPEVSYVAPGGTVQIFQATGATDPNNPATYGPEITAGPQPVNAAGSYSVTNLLEGAYVVCADATDSVAPSCELVTVNDNEQTLVNNVDLPGTISAEITDTVGGNEIRSYDDVPFGGGHVTSGTYSITVGANTTTALNFDAEAATVQAALELLGSVGAGNVSVTGGPPHVFGPPIVMEFVGALAGVDVPNIVINDIDLAGGPNAGYFQDPNLTDRDGFGTVQTLTADGRVSGGTFTLIYNGEATGPLDFDATVNEIEAALNALLTISTGGGSVNAFSTNPNVIPGTEPITKAPVEIQFVNVTDSDTTVLVVDNTNLE